MLKEITSVEPQVAAFGLLLYEMATGSEMTPPYLSGMVDVLIDNRRYRVVEDILHQIFFSKQKISLRDLVNHPFFRVQVKSHNYLDDSSDKFIREDASRRLMEPVFVYSESLYKVVAPREKYDLKLKGGGLKKSSKESDDEKSGSSSDSGGSSDSGSGSGSSSESDDENQKDKKKKNTSKKGEK